MNQNREHQSPTAEAQSLAVDSQNGQSTTTTPEIEDQPLLDHHLHHQEEDLLLEHLFQPHCVESESHLGSDSSTDVEDKYLTPNRHAGKNEIYIKETKTRITTTTTTVELVTTKKIFGRKDGIYKATKVTVDTTHIAGPHTQREEDVIEKTESGWITDDEAEDEGDNFAPGGDNTTSVGHAGN
ncbi:hypothetical protein GE21DRAFT_1947 [Neurospora crassa]|uniref:Uncharacterized protein n=2 Tax=Neurospora crassa TaxID=5141 RepID=Q7SDQ9_NEUCR|nr:hypothetical protein NCU00764 [Neurospora crassa OR74A]EAA34925.1 hypothetical protein NCU00764 [Neurospora crassa OR74A]KHE83698.1 hypothetical protein GE21DRAFT_1947 [Neurospora crassa]CAE81953.1 hypothetical protein [Neurospora crassa]|eukprot:XP_964161.1 hypothetical protein NCU00764 [Neurospora crassa OR74A]